MSTFQNDAINIQDFSNMAKDIARAKTLEETIAKVMHHVGNVFGPVSWSLLLRSRLDGSLQFVYAEGPSADQIRGRRLAKGQGVAGWVAEHTTPVLIPDVTSDQRFHAGIDEVSGFVTQSIIAVPLVNEGESYGVIELINKLNESSFDNNDLLVLQTIADFAAIAIERAYYLRSVQRLALTDVLTGLPNRRAFERALDREIEKTRRTSSVFSLLLIDVDKFKRINDQFGHSAGDESLKAVAQILFKNSRKVDVCARMGGDEFAILLPDTPEENAQALVARINEALSLHNKNASIPLSLSIGARMVDKLNPEHILADADSAMYRAKAKDNLSLDDSVKIESALEGWMEGKSDLRD